ncbi:MAG: VCBS repeat-containing protein [Planctomycetota bacterium]
MAKTPPVSTTVLAAATAALFACAGLNAQDVITLAEPKNPIVGYVPPLRSVKVADYNNDGFDDLMLLSGARQEIAFNDGFGRFVSRVVVGNDTQNDEVAVDLDGDGILDRFRTGALTDFFRGIDGVNFEPPILLNGLGSESFSSRVAPVFLDYDDDGDLDVIMTGRPATLYANDGSMNFSMVGDFIATGVTIYEFKQADLDSDGDQDLVSVTSGGIAGLPAGIVWFENLGAGNIDFAGVQIWLFGEQFDINDFDLDGDPDIVIEDRILENTGAAVWPQIGLGFNDQLAAVSLDFDGDGLKDVATCDNQAVTLHRKLPTGGFAPPVRIPDSGLSVLSGGAREPRMFAGRFDGSNREGFVTLGTGRQPELFIPTADGEMLQTRLTFGQTLSPDITRNGIVATADLNGDGFADFLFEREVPGSNAPTLAVAFGRGGGDYDSVDLSVVPLPDGFRRIETGDLDGDGDEELVASVDSIGPASTFRLLVIDGDSPSNVSVQTLSFTDPVREFQVTDFNSDGLDDFLVVGFSSFVLFRGDPATLFQTPGSSTTSLLGSPVILDVDADGDSDILNPFPPGFYFSNDGNGNFTSVPATLTVNATVIPGDLDGDGDEDLVVSDGTTRINESGGVFSVGPPILGYPSSLVSIPFPERVFLDVDSDGDLDLLVREPRAVGGIGILCLNDGTGQLTVTSLPGLVGLGITEIAEARARDFDLDGDPDLVIETGFESRDAFSNSVVSRAQRVVLSRSRSIRAPFLARLGQPYRIEVASEPSLGTGPTLAFVGISASLLAAPLGSPVPGYLLDSPVLLPTLVVLPPLGEAAMTLGIPTSPSLEGASFYVQAALLRLSPVGTFDFAVTPALRDTIAN